MKLPPSPTPVEHLISPSRTHVLRSMLKSFTGETLKLLVARSMGGNTPELGEAPIVTLAKAVLALAVKVLESWLVQV